MLTDKKVKKVTFAGARRVFLTTIRSAVMVQLLIALFLLSPALAGGLPLQQDQIADGADNEIGAGVVVEKVAPNSEAEKAGIKEGDTLLSWSRGESKGEIQSPLDLPEIETEQAPLGTVMLEGLRGTEKQIWSLGQSDWGLIMRPNFSGRLLSDFREGAKLFKSVQAAERWKDLANPFSGSQAMLLATLLYLNLGNVAYDQGDLAKAEGYHRRALEFGEKLAPESPDIAGSPHKWGIIGCDGGDLAEVEKCHRQNLAMIEKVGGGLDVDSSVEEYHRQALETFEKLAPNTFDHAETLAGLARVARRFHELEDEAAALYMYPPNALEGKTAHLGGSEEGHSGFRTEHSDIYREYIDLLLSQKHPGVAFEVLERSRARTVLEMLLAARVDIRRGMVTSLLEQKRSLQASLSAKYTRSLQLQVQLHMQLRGDEPLLGYKNKEKQATAVTLVIAALEGLYQDVEERLRQNSWGYAALMQPQPLTAGEIQQLLDADTVLLEYSLGEKRSLVFVVTRSSVSIKVYELPRKAEIERAAKAIYNFFNSRNAFRPGETRSQKRARLRQTEAGYAESIQKLSQMLLSPVAQQIKNKRLLIVADGALQYIPFAVLPSPKSNAGSREPLIAEHEIVNLPSASILSVLRREASRRKSAPKAVIVLADPVFDLHDDRLRTSLRAVNLPANPSSAAHEFFLDRSAREIGVSRNGVFPRLPFTRREAQFISSAAKPGDVTEALDFDASKPTAMSQELANYRIVHLATHGLVNSEHPELSGLVFSLFDSKGQSQDGFLRLTDVYNLNLNADLVVLSACQTALGKQINGEGLIGITRGFMYAGSARVIASLWKVDDEATAELMKKFYEGVLKNGQTPAQALRTAQMWMQNQKRWKAPYYWAGFVLLGEWK